MIGHFSTALLAIFVVNLCQIMTVSAYKCLECASPDLRNQWQLTSYPKMLADDKFDSVCDSLSPTPPDSMLVDCSSLCVEMIIPTDDRYVMLRGCLQNLLTGYRANATLSTNADFKSKGDCTYGDTERKVNLKDNTGKLVTVTGYVGIHFCESTSTNILAKELCNTAMKISDMSDGQYSTTFFDQLRVDDGKFPCPAAQTKVTCISCLSVDDNGACDKHNKGTCSGAYCSKSYGKQGVTKFVKRGCSPINPFGLTSDGCARLDIKSNTLLGDSTAGVAFRMKRDVDLRLNYQADQCYCTTDRCNGAASLTFALLSFLSPILMAIRFL